MWFRGARSLLKKRGRSESRESTFLWCGACRRGIASIAISNLDAGNMEEIGTELEIRGSHYFLIVTWFGLLFCLSLFSYLVIFTTLSQTVSSTLSHFIYYTLIPCQGIFCHFFLEKLKSRKHTLPQLLFSSLTHYLPSPTAPSLSFSLHLSGKSHLPSSFQGLQ